MWGFWDKEGHKDQIGSLNLLTPAIVRRASSEIQTGEHVQLDWSLDNVQFPGFGRKPFEQNVLVKGNNYAALDDEIHFNVSIIGQV